MTDEHNNDFRPDAELEDEIAEAEAGCGEAAIGIPVPAGHPGGHPGGHPAGVERQRHGGARSVGFRPGGGEAAQAYEARTGIKARASSPGRSRAAAT